MNVSECVWVNECGCVNLCAGRCLNVSECVGVNECGCANCVRVLVCVRVHSSMGACVCIYVVCLHAYVHVCLCVSLCMHTLACMCVWSLSVQ